MKKILLFFILLTCATSLPSCGELGLSESESIANTRWQHIEYNTSAGTVQSTLSFSSTTFVLFINQSAGTNQSYSGQYEYSGGSGTLLLGGDKAYISVSGNFLTLSWGGVNIEFTKD